MVVDLASTEIDRELVVLLVHVLLEHGLEGWVKSLADILKQHGEAHLDRGLDRHEELGRGKFDHFQTVVLLLVLDPSVTLGLWVDDQWPATIRVGGDDTIINGKVISRKTLNVPHTDL